MGYDGNDVTPNSIPSTTQSTYKTWFSKIHLNSLWSLWYGFFATILQAYIGVKCIKRILGKPFRI